LKQVGTCFFGKERERKRKAALLNIEKSKERKRRARRERTLQRGSIGGYSIEKEETGQNYRDDDRLS
jgi:hypothetical protein